MDQTGNPGYNRPCAKSPELWTSATKTLMPNQRTFCFARLAAMVSAVALAPVLSAQSNSPFVYSANNSADYGTLIAQGSLFVIFGYYLGPVTLAEAPSIPLSNVLSGTSVTVTSGATVLNCPMIYTSQTQVAAVLPSSTPAGPALLTVAYNGVSGPYGSSINIMVVPSSVGIFTTTETGQGPGIFTALDYSLITPTNSAQPGAVVTAWATGIGPISGPDNALPSSFPNFPDVQVWVGGQSAQVVYAGRSGCCVAADQIAFTVPAVANGCNVPVEIISGGQPGNTVTMPVTSGGGTCADSGPALPASLLAKAEAGQPVRLAAIGLGPKGIGNGAAVTDAVAQRLSRALHKQVPRADAARLMRAYASKNPRAIRLALAKYARQWKALSPRAKARLAAQIGQTQEGAAALFGSFGNENSAAILASAQVPTAGACIVLPHSIPSVNAVTSGLDAGPSLTVSGPPGFLSLKQNPNSRGEYTGLFASSVIGPNVPSGSYTITGSGGKDVGPFSVAVTVGNHLAISNKSSLAIIDRAQPLTVTWTGGVSGKYIVISGYTPSSALNGVYNPNTYFGCGADAGSGSFTIPSYILSSLNSTVSGAGILGIASHPLSNQITIPGMDLAYFVDGSSDSLSVTFQ